MNDLMRQVNRQIPNVSLEYVDITAGYSDEDDTTLNVFQQSGRSSSHHFMNF